MRKGSKLKAVLGLLSILLLAGCQQQAPQQETPPPPTKATTLFLVRHAEKVLDGSRDPELTEAGKARATNLATLLADAGITQVYSTKFVRTLDTVQPLADSLGISVQLYDPGNPDVIKQIANQHPGERILVGGHSNTVPPMANALLGEQEYQNLGDNEYGKIFVVTHQPPITQAYILRY